jgi:hypothetical protein
MKKILAHILLLALLLQIVFIQPMNNVYAIDGDGTNNLDLTVTSDNTVTEILGDNFTVNFSLINENSSE